LERNAWNTLGRVRREEGGGRRDGRDSLEYSLVIKKARRERERV